MPTFPNPAKLRGAIAETLWEHVSAHDLPHFCDALGMPNAPEDVRAWDSKRRYVRQRLMGLGAAELADVARAVAEQYDDPNLLGLISPAELRGVEGELKNLIFAVNGPKPRIVLRAAINNVIEIVENADFCLVYDRPLAGGLTWGELVEWWSEISPAEGSDAARALYARLRASVGSPPSGCSSTLMAFYGQTDRDQIPALVPQIYLHYDPYTMRELAQRSGQALPRQRMDFLLFADRPQVTVSAVNPLNRPTGSTNAKRSVMGEPGVAGGDGGLTLTAT